jgi:general secretion pathway protein K
MRDIQEADGETEDGSNRAFILISVIWIAGLLAVISSAFAINLRVQILSGANTLQSAKAEFISDGLVYLTAFKLAAETEKDRVIPRDGKALLCPWKSDAQAEVAVQDQGGLIDLNAASAELMTKVFLAAGLPEEKAKQLASDVEDYRDSDSDAKGGGSEPETYSGVSFGPKNAPFQAVEELDQVPGVNDELYNRLLPLLTVYSLQPGFDPELMAPGLRQLLGVGADGKLPAGLTAYSAESQGSTFGIETTVRLANGTAFRRNAVVAISRTAERPFTILSWQRGISVNSVPATALRKSSCFS